jgi:penicillin G amidase
MLHFRRTVFADQLRGSWNKPQARQILRGLERSVGLEYLQGLLHHDAASWCDDIRTTRRETCDDVLAMSLESALWELYKLRGDWSMASWNWGAVQTARYEHTPFSDMKPFGKLFERRVGNGGSENTINVAGSSFAGAEGYLQNHGASFRQIISLRAGSVSHYFMNSTGQSGNVMSAHYDDMVEPFRAVQYRVLDSTYSHTARTVARRPDAVHARTNEETER